MPLKNGKRGKKLDKNNAGGLCKLVKLYDVSKKRPRVLMYVSSTVFLSSQVNGRAAGTYFNMVRTDLVSI
jgi:hypothetical protein